MTSAVKSFGFDRDGVPLVGTRQSGPLNLISDVKGVVVGHTTLDQGGIQTGVTVIRPHLEHSFIYKVPAAVDVINGFGKSVGLVQVDELGVLETPIALTNTFSVPVVAQAQIQQAIKLHSQIGRDWATVNPLVFECNDGYLNDLHAFAVQELHYEQAYQSCTSLFKQGAVGAGRGMSSFGLKGGIGSASRLVKSSLRDELFTVGVLVMSNFGMPQNLRVATRYLGNILASALHEKTEQDKGSIIIIMATDAPLDARQLKRLCRRAGVGLARTGSYYGHGSGDIVLSFSTGWMPEALSGYCHLKCSSASNGEMPHWPTLIPEPELDDFFDAAAEATEQAIVNALFHAVTVYGRDGRCRYSLTDILPDWSRYF